MKNYSDILKKCTFNTLGCKVNQYETQAIRENFLSRGYEEATHSEKPAVCVINTCTVTKMSDRKSRQLIRKVIRVNPQAKIVVTGCYSEKDGIALAGIRGIDFIVPNSKKDKIVDIVQGKNGGDRTSDNIFSLRISSFKDHSRAFVKVQDGCNSFCSFCKVPLVRGRSWSREIKAIVEEASRLIEGGFREIVLSGICLGAYGMDLEGNLDIVDVIEMIEKFSGEYRLRLSSIEPNMVNQRLIDKMASSASLCYHFHIPLQSGDDRILKKMNRNYSVDQYKRLVEKIRNKIPQVSLTSDVLVGFPGEKEANFLNTRDTLCEIAPSRLHIFPYSRRENTAAARFKDKVPKTEVRKRVNTLKSLAANFSLNYREKFVNHKMNVLVELHRDKKSGLLTGYSDNYIKILFSGPDHLCGEIIPVKITQLDAALTLGEAVKIQGRGD